MDAARLPNFLVIGAARSGSTWISRNLARHPDVFIPREKELHFFDRRYDEGIEAYRAHFRASGAEKAIGEATPAYLHTEAAAPRIRAHLPDAKLIACLRDPIDRLYSRYWNARGRFSHNKDVSFERKIEEKPEFIREGYYAEHLQRFYALFPRDQLLVLLYDDLVSDPRGLLTRIYRFLGVDESFSSDLADLKINAGASQKLVVRSRPLYWAGKALSRLGRHRLALRIQEANSGKLPPLPSSTRSWLLEKYYRRRNERLAALLGVDLSHWNRV